MRFIQLTQTDKEVLVAILETSPSGMDIGEVRKAIKLIDKLEEGNALVSLEDSEYEYLKGRFDSTKFVRVTKELVLLADKLDEATIVSPAD